MKGSQFVSDNINASPAQWEQAVLGAIRNGWVMKWPMKKISCGEGSIFWAATDYLAIGEIDDYVRVPLGGPATQLALEMLGDGLLLPTAQMVDLIWKTAHDEGFVFAPTPIPPDAKMQSPARILQHQQKLAEEMPSYAPGVVLVAGIKKDVVMTPALKKHPGKVAIYGWHQLDGKPIQGLNASSHASTYFDYSHGIRLIGPEMICKGEGKQVVEVLKDPTLSKVLTHEGAFDPAGVTYKA